MEQTLQFWANIAQLVSVVIAVIAVALQVITWFRPQAPSISNVYRFLRPILSYILIGSLCFALGIEVNKIPLNTTNTNTLSDTKQIAVATATAIAINATPVINIKLDLPPTQKDITTIFRSQLSYRNFAVSARFYNPNDISNNTWSYGYYFRDNSTNKFYVLSITSDKKWNLRVVENNNRVSIKSGLIQNLYTSMNEFNKISLICIDKEAHLFINNGYIDTIDVSIHTAAGDIEPVGGFQASDKIGVNIHVEDFSVISLDK